MKLQAAVCGNIYADVTCLIADTCRITCFREWLKNIIHAKKQHREKHGQYHDTAQNRHDLQHVPKSTQQHQIYKYADTKCQNKCDFCLKHIFQADAKA